jgi:hypothetical protein
MSPVGSSTDDNDSASPFGFFFFFLFGKTALIILEALCLSVPFRDDFKDDFWDAVSDFWDATSDLHELRGIASKRWC